LAAECGGKVGEERVRVLAYGFGGSD